MYHLFLFPLLLPSVIKTFPFRKKYLYLPLPIYELINAYLNGESCNLRLEEWEILVLKRAYLNILPIFWLDIYAFVPNRTTNSILIRYIPTFFPFSKYTKNCWCMQMTNVDVSIKNWKKIITKKFNKFMDKNSRTYLRSTLKPRKFHWLYTKSNLTKMKNRKKTVIFIFIFMNYQIKSKICMFDNLNCKILKFLSYRSLHASSVIFFLSILHSFSSSNLFSTFFLEQIGRQMK